MKHLPMVLGVAVLLSSPVAAQDRSTSIPVRLSVTAIDHEAVPGQPRSFRVELRDIKGALVTAQEDVRVTLTSPATTKATSVVVPKGQSSATVTMLPEVAGFHDVEARAPSLPTAHTLLAVRPSRIQRSPEPSPPPPSPAPAETPQASVPGGAAPAGALSRGPSGGRGSLHMLVPGRGRGEAAQPASGATSPSQPAVTPAAAPTGTPAAPVPAPALTPGALQLFLAPKQVESDRGEWRATVGIGVLDSDNQATLASDDIRVQLAANFGVVTPDTVTIRKGSFGNDETIHLAARMAGANEVTAMSPGYGTVSASVLFNEPVPTAVRVDPSPLRVPVDGRSSATLQVRLVGANQNPVVPREPVTVVALRSSIGTLSSPTVTLTNQAGKDVACVTLVSNQSGRAEISASAAGVGDAAAVYVIFEFPWIMIACAVGGGLLGGVVLALNSQKKTHWARRLAATLIVGGILGLIVYIAALFGALSITAKMPIDATRLPAVNSLGALALGFVGGYYGSRIFESK